MAVIIPAIAGKVIHIGRAGENLATTVRFDVSDWLEEFGTGGSLEDSGVFSLYVQQGGDNIYPQELVERRAYALTDNFVDWQVTNGNTSTVGMGKCELHYSLDTGETDDDNQEIYQIVKSIIYDIVVTNSLDAEAGAEAPGAVQTWLTHIDELTTAIENANQYVTAAQAEVLKAARWADYSNTSSSTPASGISAKDYANLSQAWAEGKIGSSDISSSHVAYNKNAKYWADQAEESASRVEGLDAGIVTTVGIESTADVTRRTVEASGSTPAHYVFDFTIPRGSKWFYGSVLPTTSNVTGALAGDYYLRNNASYPYVYTFDGSTWTQGMSIKGSTGTRGSKWYAGTSITGTSTTATIFSGSGISSAIVDDQYLNTETGNTYKCTVAGAASTAKWIYTGNIRGIQGIQGIQGETGHGLEITRIFQGTSTSAFGSTFVAQGTIYGLKTSLSDTSETPKLYIQNAASGSNNWVYIGKQGGAQAELYTWS